MVTITSLQLAIDIRTETKDQVKLIGDSVSCHSNYSIWLVVFRNVGSRGGGV